MSDLDLPLAVRMMQDGYLMEIQDLKEENEKLRELVRRLYRMADFCRGCSDVELCDLGALGETCTIRDPIDKLMDKLGVEV